MLVGMVFGVSACGEARDQARGPADSVAPEATLAAKAEASTVIAANRWEQEQSREGPRSFVVTGGYRDQIGDWEPDKGVYKAAFGSGCLDVPPGVVPTLPVDGEIRWPDGMVERRPLLTPAQTYERRGIPADVHAACGRSGGTPMLTVAAVRPITLDVDTARGRATVPGWELSFADTAVRGVLVAVAFDSVPPYRSAVGPKPDLATVSADGRGLTLRFAGAPDTPGPCGADYEVRATQRSGVVAVAVVGSRRPTPTPATVDGCPAMAVTRTATLNLDEPLGDRPVIDVEAITVRR
ncbi:hypothetical protein [Embleya sp. NBC_00896]|uniref:hypothetical protein n=1 Tax=Embleya sp. NBC_00896 TaxID=2975961 RepID=UPI002F9092D3|nr:hypothetical protein OG928_41060 [Embleya sp. NBC_00896]